MHEPPVKTCQVPRGENIPSQYMGYLHALLIILIASGGSNLGGASCLCTRWVGPLLEGESSGWGHGKAHTLTCWHWLGSSWVGQSTPHLAI